MKSIYSIVALLLLAVSCSGDKEISWKIADNPLITEWALQVDPLKPWNVYPRPDMRRKEWMNLNGLWDYAIAPVNSVTPEAWDGRILVPYPVESALSGVKRSLSQDELIWYRREFTIPSKWKGKRIILNFEASDWQTTVWVNGMQVGSHRGGYDPFSFDITEAADRNRRIEMIISVWDPTNRGSQPRGKQVMNPGSIWYTPSSGIWQTVWVEPVGDSYIRSFRVYTSVEESTISVVPEIENRKESLARLTVSRGGKILGYAESLNNEVLKVRVDDAVLWTPDNPALYDLQIELLDGNRVIDDITSVAGIRKVSLGKTDDGFTRIMLNDEFLFQNGPLDQGFWPDGLYTPPTEEAMIYDLWMLKKMGFNMLRKHVKVENRVFYNWCDRIGLLVWQDMPSGDKHISGNMPDIRKDPEADAQFRFELRRMIETRFNNPSIIIWVPFNEGWGQYDTEGITRFIRETDTTRLVNSASGWTDRGTGHLRDIHNYPDPMAPVPEEGRASVLGEYGGLGLPVQNHTWEKQNWGYSNMSDADDLLSRYEKYQEIIRNLVKNRGLSAVVYTQTTDVETETNGLLTYDRKVDKMGADNVSKANRGIIPPYMVNRCSIFTDTINVGLASFDTTAVIRYTTDGREPVSSSPLFVTPQKITETTTLLAKAWYNGNQSRTVSFTVTRKEPRIAEKDTIIHGKGLSIKVFEGTFNQLPDLDSLESSSTIISDELSIAHAGTTNRFALLFEGFIEVPDTGVYGFHVTSDDGSRLTIGDETLIQNDGIHGMVEKSGYVALSTGLHPFRLEYFQRTGGLGLEVSVESRGNQKLPLPEGWLFH